MRRMEKAMNTSLLDQQSFISGEAGSQPRAGVDERPAPPPPPEPPADAAASARPAWRRPVLLALGAVLLAGASGGTGAVLAVHYDGHTTTVVSGSPASGSSASSPASELAGVAAAVKPSIVTITVQTGTSTGEASGVIIGSDGDIVTNDHVIEDAADGAGTIKVTFSTGRTADASIVGQDASADIAVIRAAGVSGLKPATLGSASALHVGDTVLAIGSPLGLEGSVTSGIVSALNRTISVGSSSGQPFGQQATSKLTGMIQTDTAINPGNSGGALLNDSGQVIGITTAIASTGGGYIGQESGSIGIGFAIPAATAITIANQILAR
jgi:putative serine protease PepD